MNAGQLSLYRVFEAPPAVENDRARAQAERRAALSAWAPDCLPWEKQPANLKASGGMRKPGQYVAG